MSRRILKIKIYQLSQVRQQKKKYRDANSILANSF